MADDEDEDYFFFGTPLPEAEDLRPRQRQAAEKAGQLKTLPVWKQEVTDEEGRKRFHGAFTGGFSAGFYNTVGSKEGWAPTQFVSSRKKRAEKLAQVRQSVTRHFDNLVRACRCGDCASL
jgi:G patch domain-containing protein 1